MPPSARETGQANVAYEAIHRVVQDWVLLRDSGRWDDFAALWHEDGWMSATWFQGPYHDFIDASRMGATAGVQIAHFLGGFTCEVRARRSVAQTKMKIEQRAVVHGQTVDVTCSGRFYDFFEERDGRWGIVRRQPIYEKDRLDLLDPDGRLQLDPTRLATFPAGYRYLGYVQEMTGQAVKRGLPGLTGPEVDDLYREGAAWLEGSPAPGRSHLTGRT